MIENAYQYVTLADKCVGTARNKHAISHAACPGACINGFGFVTEDSPRESVDAMIFKVFPFMTPGILHLYLPSLQ